MRAVLTRLAAGAALALATGLSPVLPAAPASAAACSDGVTVVVDFKGLGGGGETIKCVKDGQQHNAATLFGKAGFPLTYVQRQAGFVCRISGKPTAEQDPCVVTPPTDAYWGLFFSNGTNGSWSYATTGAGGLKVPQGGSVGFAWQSGGRVSPGTAPPRQEKPKPAPSKPPASTPPSAAPTPTTPSPSAAPTPSATPSSSASAGVSPSATPSATSTVRYGAKPVDMPTATETPTVPSDSAVAAADAPVEAEIEAASSETDDGGLPLWVPLSVIALGLAGAGAAYYRRRNG